MGTAEDLPPPLIPPTPDSIPAEMRAARRWAPWRAEWNAKKKKYGKVPHRADRPEHGLSNKTARGWVSFEEAMAAYLAAPDKFAGVGYLMTGAHGRVGVDLDHCRDPATGAIAPWAAEIAAKLDSYTEVSPSGTGLHVIVAGDVAEDWANHDQGVEIYGGNVPRFLAITGELVPGAPRAIRPLRAPVLDMMASRWRKKLTAAEVHDLHLPDLIPDVLLPELEELDLPTHARNFLTDGPEPGDRSRQLFATSIALHQAGLSREEVLSILEANEHAMEVALDHRKQDYDKALRYLWKDHCQAGGARAAGIRQLQLDEFDDLEPLPAAPDAPPEGQAATIDDFEVLEDEPPQQGASAAPAPAKTEKRARFALSTPAEFLRRPAATWIMRGVLPRAGLAVIFGASGSGKTFLTMDIAMSVVRGEAWRGRPVAKGRGVYIVAEGASGFRTRLEAYCEHHGVDPDSLDIRFITDAPNLLDKADIRELLIAILQYGKVDFVVIDTYARAMAGANENDAKDVGQAVAHCDAIHRKTGALVILVHHSGKDANSGARGSSVLRAAADVEIEVTRTREYRSAIVTKMKDGADGQEFRFKLGEVAMGEDEDGEPITSCIIEHMEGTTPRGVQGLRGHALTVFNTTSAMLDLGGEVSHAHAIEACVSVMEVTPGKRDRRRDLVTVAFDALVSKGVLKIENGNVSLQ